LTWTGLTARTAVTVSVQSMDCPMYLITGLADLRNTLAYLNEATLGQGKPKAFIHHMEGLCDEANSWPCRAGSMSTGLDEKARLRKL